MNYLATLYHIASADVLERIRRPSFFIVIVLSLYAGYFFAPEADAGYVIVSIGNVRGIYNSAWIGAVFSLMCSTFLSLIGFYLVKGSVARDRETQVAQVLASTRMSGFQYLLGKTLSNFAVLCAVVVTLLVIAIVTQLIRAEDTSVNLWHIVSPTLFMALPYLLVISAVTVLFEVTPLLRGAFGNVAYFFLWNIILVLTIAPSQIPGEQMNGTNDLPGITQLFDDMMHEIPAGMDASHERVALGIQITDDSRHRGTFVWSGMDWTAGVMLARLIWVGLALGIVLFATPIFRRFESLAILPRKSKKKTMRRDEEPVVIASPAMPSTLAQLATHPRLALIPLVQQEVWLALKGANRWWHLGMAGLIILTLVTPMTAAQQYLFPLAWIWPVAIWSAMGTREKKHRVEQLVYSAPHFLRYQLTAMWAAGVVIAAAAGSGMAIRFLLAGEMNYLFAWGVGILFIPTFALAAGVWTGRALLFEAVYVALWYIGPMNQIQYIDFMGATPMVTPAITMVFLMFTAGLALLAVVGRKRQLTM